MEKNKIHTYIVNLPSSTARKEYMENLLKDSKRLDIEFIDAVYGKALSEKELNERFDLDRSFQKYGRKLNRGEVGCTLSHRKCYRHILNSGYKCVLILEDDVTLMRNLEEVIDDDVMKILESNKPAIVFLSGDYWRLNSKKVSRVYAAVGSYAYLINKEAAKLADQSGKAFTVADDWDYFKQLGIKLYAVWPYAVDANIEDLPSDIAQEHWGYLRDKIKFKYRLRGILTGAVKKGLVKVGKFESKKR